MIDRRQRPYARFRLSLADPISLKRRAGLETTMPEKQKKGCSLMSKTAYKTLQRRER